MPALIIPDTVEVVLKGARSTGEVINVFRLHRTGGASEADCQAIALSFLSAILPKVLACLSQDYFAQSITVNDISVAGGSTYTYALVGPYPGARTGDSLPGNVALCVSWRTGHRGRAWRGRTFVGPLSENDVTGDNLAAGLINLLVLLAQALIEWAPIIGAVFAVGSRSRNASTPITGFAMDYWTDSQRRRLTGRGA